MINSKKSIVEKQWKNYKPSQQNNECGFNFYRDNVDNITSLILNVYLWTETSESS